MLNNEAFNNYVTLRDVIKAYLGEENLDQRHYARILPIAVRGYQKLYGEVIKGVKTALLPFSNPDVRIMNFPDDYVYYTKIGVIVNWGSNGTPVIMTLSRNDRLHLFTQEEIAEAACNCDEDATVSGNLQLLTDGFMPFNTNTLFKNVVRGGQVIGELWGAGGGISSAGAFREDKDNRRFIFSNDVPMDSIIIMEYKTSGVERGLETRIPLDAQEALIAWIGWRLNKNNRNMERLFDREYKQLQYRQNAVTMSEIYDVLERGGKIIKW